LRTQLEADRFVEWVIDITYQEMNVDMFDRAASKSAISTTHCQAVILETKLAPGPF
jgi:hypothetical protein